MEQRPYLAPAAEIERFRVEHGERIAVLGCGHVFACEPGALWIGYQVRCGFCRADELQGLWPA